MTIIKCVKTTGIVLPPSKIKIWVRNNHDGASSAPMLNHYSGFIVKNSNDTILKFLTNVGLSILQSFFSFICPDIIICQSEESDLLYRTVCHELSHASHFSVVTSSYWGRYIQYIGTYGTKANCYGDGSGTHSGYCGVGEMWGYFMGNEMAKKYIVKSLLTEKCTGLNHKYLEIYMTVHL